MRCLSAFHFLFTTMAILLILSHVSVSANPISTSGTMYHSQEDDLITLRRLSVLPMIDNVGGIYSRPLESYLIELIKNDHHWDYEDVNLIGPLVSPEELESSAEKVSQISSGTKSDGILSSRLIKGPGGISIKLNLFSTKDHKLLAQAEERNISNFEVPELQKKVKDLFSQIVKKIPYDGIVLSRQGEMVTINLGKNDGIEPDKVLSVVQIIKLNRHPKFHFLINSEKEILGKIKVLKVDETLSFGKVVTEKEKGVVQKNSKISGVDFVKYHHTSTLTDSSVDQDQLMGRPDALVSFGKGATAWLPKKTPTFGLAYAGLGNSFYSYNVQETESLNADSFFNPNIFLGGELWLSPNWTLHAGLRQGIISIGNPKSGSTPDDLSASMSLYEFLIGYKFRLGPSIWGPQLDLMAGMSTYDLKIDDSSPRAFTSTKYSGLKLAVRGTYPLDLKEDWSLGANLSFFFNPNLNERPSSSGRGADNSIHQFGFFVFRKLDINLRAQLGLDFELFKTNFSANSTTTSSSQKLTTLNCSLAYLF